MILRTLIMLVLGLIVTIFAIFGYLIIFLDFLFWDPRVIQRLILNPNGDWNWREVAGTYAEIYEKAWRCKI